MLTITTITARQNFDSESSKVDYRHSLTSRMIVLLATFFPPLDEVCLTCWHNEGFPDKRLGLTEPSLNEKDVRSSHDHILPNPTSLDAAKGYRWGLISCYTGQPHLGTRHFGGRFSMLRPLPFHFSTHYAETDCLHWPQLMLI